jgi:hypothetical protein
MRTFNFLLLAMLSCIAMIGAAPIGNGAPAEAIERRKSYVPLQQLMEVLIQLKNLSPGKTTVLREWLKMQFFLPGALNFSPPR